MIGSMKSAGQMFRDARKALGVSMRAIGRMTGKDHSYLSLLENDKISPTVDSLREICPAYGLEPWEVACGLTRAELVASLPIPRQPMVAESSAPYGSTLALVNELIAKHGEDGVRALLMAAQRLPDPAAFNLALRMFKAAMEPTDGA